MTPLPEAAGKRLESDQDAVKPKGFMAARMAAHRAKGLTEDMDLRIREMKIAAKWAKARFYEATSGVNSLLFPGPSYANLSPEEATAQLFHLEGKLAIYLLTANALPPGPKENISLPHNSFTVPAGNAASGRLMVPQPPVAANSEGFYTEV